MTSETKLAHLPDRGVIAVTGTDAAKFLHGLLTNDMLGLTTGTAAHAGLLSPQGKILFDMLVLRTGEDSYLLDCSAGSAAALAKRLAMYKLRAPVQIADQTAEHSVLARWGAPSAGASSGIPGGHIFSDPRDDRLGERLIVPSGLAGNFSLTASSGAYHDHRIACGVPEGGRDFSFGDAYPHEALFDRLNGVSFTKGCYVGQEIVSRMQHRSTARKRIVPIRAATPLATATPVLAGDVEIGTVGSVADMKSGGSAALALLRLDRVAEALEKGVPVTSGGAVIEVSIPEWARTLPAGHS